MSYISFYYLINQVVDGGKSNLTVKDAIDNTYSYLGLENDFYYDYESLDRIFLINTFELCKSVFLTSYDKGYDQIGVDNSFIEPLLAGCVPSSDKVRAFRNCLAHDDYTFDDKMSIIVTSTWDRQAFTFSIDVIDFYNYTRGHLFSLHDVWNEKICFNEISDFRGIFTIEDAEEYIQESLNQISEDKRHFISKILLNEDFSDLPLFLLSHLLTYTKDV